MQITSSAVHRCDSPLHWIYTGVSQGKLIQNGFVTKQHSFVPNKRFPLPAWGQKKSFCSSPEIGSQALHYAGRTWEPSLFIMNPTVCTAAARTSLVGGGSLQNGAGGGAAKHLFCLGSHAPILFKTRKNSESRRRAVISSSTEFSDELWYVQSLPRISFS